MNSMAVGYEQALSAATIVGEYLGRNCLSTKSPAQRITVLEEEAKSVINKLIHSAAESNKQSTNLKSPFSVKSFIFSVANFLSSIGNSKKLIYDSHDYHARLKEVNDCKIQSFYMPLSESNCFSSLNLDTNIGKIHLNYDIESLFKELDPDIECNSGKLIRTLGGRTISVSFGQDSSYSHLETEHYTFKPDFVLGLFLKAFKFIQGNIDENRYRRHGDKEYYNFEQFKKNLDLLVRALEFTIKTKDYCSTAKVA